MTEFAMKELKAIGYWINYDVLDYNEEARKLNAAELELPDPERLVDCRRHRRAVSVDRSLIGEASW